MSISACLVRRLSRAGNRAPLERTRVRGGRTMRQDTQSHRKTSVTLWIIQGLLAGLFLFAGSMKLITPLEVMMEQMTMPLPGWFLQFIGICEVLGAFGLVLPALLRI